MRNILSTVIRGVREVYHRAEDLIEEERDFPISENLLNAQLKRYVTDKVEQLSDLHLNIYDDSIKKFGINFHKIGVNLALLWFKHIKNTDPLGYILETLEVVTVKHGLLYLDLNRWLGDVDKVMSALRKVEVNHAVLRPQTLVVKASVKLAGLFGGSDDDSNSDDLSSLMNEDRQY